MDKQRGGRSNRIDPESTELMSEETKAALIRMLEDARVNPMAQVTDKNGNRIGKVFVFGTAGDDSQDFKALHDMFINPKNYKIT